MIKNSIFIFIIIFLLIISSCLTIYNYNLESIKEPENNMKIYLFLDTIKPNIQIEYSIKSDNLIEDYIFHNGFVQIGNDITYFTQENLYISVKEIETNYMLVNNRLGIADDKINIRNQKYKDIYAMKFDNYNYKISLQRNFDEHIDEIKESTMLKIFLEYSIIINNKVIHEIIDENYNLVIRKDKITIFHLYKAAIFDGWTN